MCGFPLHADNYEKTKYRVKVLEIEGKIKDFKTIRKSILNFSIYALIGSLIVFTFNLIHSTNNYYSTFVFLIISLVYFLLYKFESFIKDNLLLILIMLSFYVYHSYFEFINQIDPREFLSSYSFKKTGHFHFIPLLADTLHYIYYIMRLVIIYYFIQAIWIVVYFKRNRLVYKYLIHNYTQ